MQNLLDSEPYLTSHAGFVGAASYMVFLVFVAYVIKLASHVSRYRWEYPPARHDTKFTGCSECFPEKCCS